MATNPPSNLILSDISGNAYDLGGWLTTFNMLLVAIDPFTYESSWILETAGRVLRHYDQADVRVGFLVTSDAEGARSFLGDFTEEFQVLIDPEKAFVKAMGLERLPALVYVRQSAELGGAAEGWQPDKWCEVLETLESDLSWRSRQTLPLAGDPAPYEGSASVA